MKNNTVLNIHSFLFIILTFLIVNFSINSQSWLNMGTGSDGDVNATIIYNNELIAAGSFIVAGGQQVNHIARWNGTSWQQLGLGTNDDIYALAIYSNFLVAAGKFTTAGGVSCNKVAFWNGTSWNTTGGVINGNVYALTVMGTSLIIGGNFTQVNGKNTLRIAKWVNAWDTIGVGFNGDVNALAMYNTIPYAGGNFTAADGLPVNRISKWDGTRWTNVGVGMDDGGVFCMRVFNNLLYVGGTFAGIGGSTTNRIARWNGTSWANASFGFSSGVYALHSLGTLLYAGGDFDFADFQPASKIAKFNGSNWSALGSGLGGTSPKVKALSSFLGDVVVGGHFSTAGGQNASNIALWRLTTGINPISNIIPENYSLKQNYPNPFNPVTKINFSLPTGGNVNLSIYDSKGELVNVLINDIILAGEYESTFDASNLPSGVYFYKILANGYSDTKKMILVK